MPTLKRRYPGLKFPVATVKEAIAKLEEIGHRLLTDVPNAYNPPPIMHFVIALASGDEWEIDSREEFYDFYRSPDTTDARIDISSHLGLIEFSFSQYMGTEVKFSHQDRAIIYELFDVFQAGVNDASNSYPPTEDVPTLQPVVFIGHGGSGMWRELKESLELQKMTVITYETEKRLGDSVKETLESMLYKCNFAVLLHTGEDEQRDGPMRARQNVVHETGLFQGRLGFPRAIIVREEKCESFSNVHGINESHFGQSIREVFGDVLLAIRRELEEPTGPNC